MIANNDHKKLVNTARVTGIWYLLMAISGVFGFMVFHPLIFISGDIEQTLSNLIEFESKARIRLLFEFVIVISQALTAIWFYKLFKNIKEWAAYALSVWGIVNSVLIMISAISMASAIEIANSSIHTIENKILTVDILQNLITNAWGVGGLFFGLWLLPMGYVVMKSERMPIWLGRIIFIGGFGYILNTVLNYSVSDFQYNDYLTIPATIGEFWMIGYLLIFGIRPVKE